MRLFESSFYSSRAEDEFDEQENVFLARDSQGQGLSPQKPATHKNTPELPTMRIRYL